MGDVWNTKCVVKVDDSAAGIVAGLHAGCWTVGIAKTGNYVGLTEEAMKNGSQRIVPKGRLCAKKSLQSRLPFCNRYNQRFTTCCRRNQSTACNGNKSVK